MGVDGARLTNSVKVANAHADFVRWNGWSGDAAFIRLAICATRVVVRLPPRMPLTLTRLETRIIALLALLIVLGLIGMSVL